MKKTLTDLGPQDHSWELLSACCRYESAGCDGIAWLPGKTSSLAKQALWQNKFRGKTKGQSRLAKVNKDLF